ncbi:MAG: hypothetical protein E7241_06970 [Lachnospiraceae bacterium]|nr:hypothetical protein [Lachnospiraceae bacterium]
MNLALCICAIVISIFVGWKFKLNTGVIALVFAFAIGVCAMGLKVNEIIAFWPTTIVFYLLSISLFFNYATINGTMDVLGKKLLYALGGNAKFIPIAIALVCGIVGGLGAGASTPAIVGPFAFVMANAAGVNPVLTCVCIAFGNLLGSNNPINGYGGVIGMNLIKKSGADLAASADAIGTYTWINSIIASLIIIIFYYIIKKGYKAEKVAVEKPPKFTDVQSKTFALIIIAFFFMVVPALLNAWVKNDIIKAVANFCQPQVIMIIGAVLCGFMKLAEEKAVIKMIPINTIVMIVGVYTLIQVATKAGLVDAITQALQTSIPPFLVPAAIVFFAAFLSFFSSSTSTVMPLMYPLVPGLAASLSLNPVMLYACIFFGGLSTAVSPFSTGGALTIASCSDNEVKEQLTNKMIIVALVCPLITMVIATIGLFGFFSV